MDLTSLTRRRLLRKQCRCTPGNTHIHEEAMELYVQVCHAWLLEVQYLGSCSIFYETGPIMLHME